MARALFLVDLDLGAVPSLADDLKNSALGLLQTLLDKHMTAYNPEVSFAFDPNVTNLLKPYSEADVKFVEEWYKAKCAEPEFVDKYYQMDPDTEDIIHGVDLQNGMRVLIGADHHRAYINDESLMTESNRARAMEFNRWMTVEKFVIRDQAISFVGVYDDGMKKLHQYDSLSGWYVKKDSISNRPQKVKPADIWDKVEELSKFVQELDQTMVPIAELYRSTIDVVRFMGNIFEPEEIYTEETVPKVLNAIVDCGIEFNLAKDIVGTIQSAGILFRERARIAPDDPSLVNPAEESQLKKVNTIAERDGDLEKDIVDLGKFSSRADYEKAKGQYKKEHPDYDGGFFCMYDPPLSEDEESYEKDEPDHDKMLVNIDPPYLGKSHDV